MLLCMGFGAKGVGVVVVLGAFACIRMFRLLWKERLNGFGRWRLGAPYRL